MVSSMGGNIWDDKGCDNNVISTAMDAGSDDTGYGTDVTTRKLRYGNIFLAGVKKFQD